MIQTYKPYKLKAGENYFQALADEAAKLDALAEPLLEGRPEWSMEELGGKQMDLAWAWLKREGEDYSKLPEGVAGMFDFGSRFTSAPHNGSLKYSLAWSMGAMEAHAWAWYDYLLVGKNVPFEMPFPCLGEVLT